MLLPAASIFDSLHHSTCASESKSPISPTVSGFFSTSSCRALQAILGNRPMPALTLTIPSDKAQRHQTLSPQLVKRQALRTPLQERPVNNVTRPQSPPERRRAEPKTPLQKAQKRSWSDFDADRENNTESGWGSDPAFWKSMSSTRLPISVDSQDKDPYSTPKRQRRVPLLMPLGLSADDFEGLAATPKPEPREYTALSMPLVHEDENDKDWSVQDDKNLVSVVLRKLNLSPNEWNECAQSLGKDVDSLGKRWKALVVDEQVGLRRGRGVRSRPELMSSWTRPSDAVV